MLGPALTALSIALFTRGEEGIPTMLRKLAVRHSPTLWLTLAVPWVAAVGLLALWAREPEVNPEEVVAGARLLLVPGVGAGVLSAIAEEIGWRGFLFPALASFMKPLRAALVTGFIAMAWNVAAFLLGAPGIGRAAGSALLPISAAVAVPWSVVQGWLYRASGGSLLLAAAFTVSATTAFVAAHAPLHTGTVEARTYWSLWEMVLANLVALPFTVLLSAASTRRAAAAASPNAGTGAAILAAVLDGATDGADGADGDGDDAVADADAAAPVAAAGSSSGSGSGSVSGKRKVH